MPSYFSASWYWPCEYGARMVWLIFGSTLFILLVFPFLLSSTITKPLRSLLDGVRRVNEGDLDTKVPVTVRDELGYLAHNSI